MVTAVTTIKMSLLLTGRPGPMCKPSVTTISGTQSHAWEGGEQGARTVSELRQSVGEEKRLRKRG